MFAEISARSSSCTNPAQLRLNVPQPVVVGLFRDLRGIATATSTRRTYSLLFDWLVRWEWDTEEGERLVLSGVL